jgi:hypothetical protein
MHDKTKKVPRSKVILSNKTKKTRYPSGFQQKDETRQLWSTPLFSNGCVTSQHRYITFQACSSVPKILIMYRSNPNVRASIVFCHQVVTQDIFKKGIVFSGVSCSSDTAVNPKDDWLKSKSKSTKSAAMNPPISSGHY